MGAVGTMLVIDHHTRRGALGFEQLFLLCLRHALDHMVQVLSAVKTILTLSFSFPANFSSHYALDSFLRGNAYLPEVFAHRHVESFHTLTSWHRLRRLTHLPVPP
jgi:hypothetical protein